MSQRFQFSLKRLFVAVLVVAAFLVGAESGAKRERQRLKSEIATYDSRLREVRRVGLDRLHELQQQAKERATAEGFLGAGTED